MPKRVFHTCCCECWLVCGVLVYVDEETNKIVEVKGDVENPLNRVGKKSEKEAVPWDFGFSVGECGGV